MSAEVFHVCKCTTKSWIKRMFTLLFLWALFDVVCVPLMLFVGFLLSINWFCFGAVMFIRFNIFFASGTVLGFVVAVVAFCASAWGGVFGFVCGCLV